MDLLLHGFFILTLSATPCCAGESDYHEFENQPLHQNDHEQHDEHETCNPFCICACGGCVGFFSPQPCSFEFKAITFSTAILPFSFLASFFSNPAYQIWQPPKI